MTSRSGFGNAGAIMSVNVQKLIDSRITVEGDFVDHPSDKGGPTRFGVTEGGGAGLRLYRRYARVPAPLGAGNFSQALLGRGRLDRIADIFPALAEQLFDIAINQGTSVPGTLLQRLLNVMNRQGSDYSDIKVDSRIGTMTLAALPLSGQARRCRPRVLIRAS
jgi:lysozyme family protein